MAHHIHHRDSGYGRLVDRLNRFPQGAPPSELLYKILKMLFSEREAGLVASLPIRPFTARQAARIWEMSASEADAVLDELSRRAILVDMEQNGKQVYCLPPPMAGFFEFSMMRLRDDLDQRVLSELFYEYINVEEEFIKSLFIDGTTQLGRVFVHEPALSPESSLQVLDYERASRVIETASHIGVGLCYCRHKMEHLGKACQAPQDICMTFNTTAASLVKHGFARPVEASECLDLLQKAYENNLVQFGENVRSQVNFICNCCSCCCEAMVAVRRFGFLHPVHTTNFIPSRREDTCAGCGKCVRACPVEAVQLSCAGSSGSNGERVAHISEELCLGCGLCVRACPTGSLELKPRRERVVTPVNSVHRVVLMAVEREKLQELIFDNQVLWSHRALAAVLGAVLRLRPVKRSLANRQLRSRYFEALMERFHV